MPRGVYERKSIWIRFWEKIDRSGPTHQLHGNCWTWLGYKNDAGYGIIKDETGIRHRVHRISWIYHKGRIPNGLCVCHKCDNPTCVNINHLFLGTLEDNCNDRHRKGRSKSHHQSMNVGESNASAKLTAQNVDMIRDLYIARHPLYGASALARLLGVSQTTVSKIVRGERWVS